LIHTLILQTILISLAGFNTI